MTDVVSGSVTPRDIIGILQHAWNYHNRDKNQLCRALDAIMKEVDNFHRVPLATLSRNVLTFGKSMWLAIRNGLYLCFWVDIPSV
ncbi:MAG TPA: hypothetical protein VI037_06615 [Nitrososphaera sp.]